MSRSPGVTVGRLQFSTKAAAESHFRDVIRRYPIGATISADDTPDIAALLDLHPGRANKVGCGVAGFSVTTDTWAHPCLVVIRTDRSSTDFSYREALSPTPPIRKFKGALRRAIVPDLLAARDVFMARNGERVPCAVSGVMLHLRGRDNDVHIDHRSPNTFDTICAAFIAEQKLADFAPLLAPHRDNDMADKLADPALAIAFRRLHWSLAELDFVTRAVNLGTAAKLPRRNPPHIILRDWILAPTEAAA